MPRIPDCNKLFQRYFVPWYDPDDLERLGIGSASGAMARPDVMQLPDYTGMRGSESSPLRKMDQRECIKHLEKAMFDAAVSDFRQRVDLLLPLKLSSIQAIDKFYDTGEIAKLISSSDPSEDGNPYLITCIELGTMIASMMRSIVPELE